jgi:hypothetical protein
MGVSFHSAGCIKFTEECWNESCAVNITGAPRHKDQRKTRRCRRAPFRGLIGQPSVARLCGLLVRPFSAVASTYSERRFD